MFELNPENSDLIVIETKSISVGYAAFQELLRDPNLKPLEAFPTMGGAFAMLFQSPSGSFKKNSFTNKWKKSLLDLKVIANINKDVLKSFYNLSKEIPKQKMFVCETKTLGSCLSVAQQGKDHHLQIIEIRSARSLVNLNYVILTGSEKDMKTFKKKFKKTKEVKNFQFFDSDKLFSDFFSFSV